jgi:hypothetical protein
VKATRFLLEALNDPVGRPFTIKWLSRTLWTGSLDPNVTMGQIEGILEVALKVALAPAEPRLISQRKRATGPMQVKEMKSTLPADRIMAFVGTSLKGGGKEQTRTQIKNALASTLLEQRHDLKWISSTMDAILSKVGTHQGLAVAQLPGGHTRHEKLMQMIHDCQIELPPQQTKQAAKQVAHNVAHKQRKMAATMPDPSHYTIEAGFLKNSVGTEAKQRSQVNLHPAE